MKILTAALVSTFADLDACECSGDTGQTAGGDHSRLANPVSNDSVDDQTETFGELGPAFGFTYLYQFQRYLSIGGDFNYKYLRTKDATTGHGPVEIRSSAWTCCDREGRPAAGQQHPAYGLLGLGVGGVRRSKEYSTSQAWTPPGPPAAPPSRWAAGWTTTSMPFGSPARSCATTSSARAKARSAPPASAPSTSWSRSLQVLNAASMR